MIIQIDLKRNPDISSLIADMNMGDPVKFITTLKSRNDTLAEFTLEKAEELSPDEMKEREDDGDGEDAENADEDTAEGDSMKSHSKMPAPSSSPNTPGGSQEQDKTAAALTAQL